MNARMKLIVNAAVLFAAVLAGTGAFAAQIALKGSAETKYQYVKFGDIAAVTGVDKETESKINDMFCGAAPDVGEVREINADYIRMRLRQNDIDPKDFKFIGAEVVTLKVAVTVELPVSADVEAAEKQAAEKPAAVTAKPAENQTPVPAASTTAQATPVSTPAPFSDRMRDALAKCVADKLNVGLADVAVEIKTVSKPLDSCKDDAEITKVDARGDNVLGAATFNVVVRSGDREVRGTVAAQVTVSIVAVVAMQDIPAGTPVKADMLALQRVEVTSIPSNYFASAAQLDGFKTAKNVVSGKPVTMDMVENPVLVKRNELVKVIVRVPGSNVTVEACARAEKDGRKGDSINVTNVNSKETFSARVTGLGTVEVIAGER